MDAVQADFDTIVETGADYGPQHQPVAKIIHDLGAAWNAIEQTGDAPDGHATALVLGEAGAGNYKKVRLAYDGTSVLVQVNNGTDAAENWANLMAINATTDATIFAGALAITGALTGVAGLTLSGALALGGNDITNVGAITCTTINAVDPATHAARHAPGGADALTVASSILSVAAANSAGSSADLARGNHAHRGVSSFEFNGAGTAYGPFDFVNDASVALDTDHITVANAAGDITFTYDPPDYIYVEEAADVDVAGTTPKEFTTITAQAITGADGTKKYRVDSTLQILLDGGVGYVEVRLHVGANGNSGDGVEAAFRCDGVAADFQQIIINGYEITPSAADKVGFSIYSLSDCRVEADGDFKSFIRVTEVQA